MALLTAEQILATPEREYRVIPVPEWGPDAEVRLQSLTGKERDKFEASLTVRKNGKDVPNYENARAKLIAACAVDENGYKLFTNSAQIDMLGGRSVAALQRLFNACQAMNGMSDQDIEELVGDFDQKGDGASPSSTD